MVHLLQRQAQLRGQPGQAVAAGGGEFAKQALAGGKQALLTDDLDPRRLADRIDRQLEPQVVGLRQGRLQSRRLPVISATAMFSWVCLE